MMSLEVLEFLWISKNAVNAYQKRKQQKVDLSVTTHFGSGQCTPG